MRSCRKTLAKHQRQTPASFIDMLAARLVITMLKGVALGGWQGGYAMRIEDGMLYA